MIWATVCSHSCFCWLYRASPSLAAKNIICLISLLIICCCLVYRVVTCVVGRGCFLWPVHSLGKALLAFALLHFVLQGQTCLWHQVSLDFLLLHSSPLWWRGHPFLVLILEGLVGLHRTAQHQLLQHYWSGHRLGLQWYWRSALEMNRDHSVIFETASKYCISDSFVDYDGHSISSKGFLPTVGDIMVIWVKIHPFQSILVHWVLKCQRSLLPSPVWSLPICLDSWA